MNSLVRMFCLCLSLNFRSKQAIVYGYLVPVLFLVAFGSVFRGEIPPLEANMGQLLAITLLGGGCFGMPTALVAERERGIWRRYRLLPASPFRLMLPVLAARLVLMGSSAALQAGLARLMYGAPLPAAWGTLCIAVAVVSTAFLGLGLLIAAVADDVPAVQALGQCLFLPMIMIGGMGIPLISLPAWAQVLSGFMPGRYAVDLLEAAYTRDGLGSRHAFDLVALLVIGLAASASGARLFRWEAGRRIGRSAAGGLALAIAAWAAIGVAAYTTGRLKPVSPQTRYADVTEQQIAAIRFDQLPGDGEFVSRLAPPFNDRGLAEGVADVVQALPHWPPSQTADVVQNARALLSLAGVADVSEDPREGPIARAVFDELLRRHGAGDCQKILTIVLSRHDDGTVVVTAPEFRLPHHIQESVIRERVDLYGRKLLGRLRGALPN